MRLVPAVTTALRLMLLVSPVDSAEPIDRRQLALAPTGEAGPVSSATAPSPAARPVQPTAQPAPSTTGSARPPPLASRVRAAISTTAPAVAVAPTQSTRGTDFRSSVIVTVALLTPTSPRIGAHTTPASSRTTLSGSARRPSHVASVTAALTRGPLGAFSSATSFTTALARPTVTPESSSPASPPIVSSTVTVTPPVNTTGVASTARPAALVADAAASPFQPGSRWFTLALTALIVGSLVLLAAAFFLLKRSCIRGSVGSSRWSKADEEKVIAMPWDPPAAAALERQHSASLSAASTGISPAGSLRSPPTAVLDFYAGYPTVGDSHRDWFDDRDPCLHPFPAPPPRHFDVERHAYEDAYDADAAEVILPPSQAYLAHQAASGPHRPGNF